MQDITIDPRDFLTGPISKRASKLCQKLEESSQEDKKAYFAKIIQECEYNQTTNKPSYSNKAKNGKKQVRKKTDKELKLLEYFMEQDPEWSRTTVATAAKVLDLTCYQVYKWGYDRKNRKDSRPEGCFVKDVEVSKDILDKINEMKDESHQNNAVNLNQQVDDLLIGSSKYKNLDENWTEFPIDEFNFLSDHAVAGESSDAFSDNSSKIGRKRVANVFKITKVNKRARRSENQCAKNASNHHWHGWHTHENPSQCIFIEDADSDIKNHDKFYEVDVNDRVSDITNDKSLASVTIRAEHTDKLSQFCENSHFSR